LFCKYLMKNIGNFSRGIETKTIKFMI
jgi:hypothetical protein